MLTGFQLYTVWALISTIWGFECYNQSKALLEQKRRILIESQSPITECLEEPMLSGVDKLGLIELQKAAKHGIDKVLLAVIAMQSKLVGNKQLIIGLEGKDKFCFVFARIVTGC